MPITCEPTATWSTYSKWSNCCEFGSACDFYTACNGGVMTRIDGLTGFWYVLSQVHMVGVIDANSKKK